MAKRIDRSRIDAGKVELPRNLAFLTDEKVDYLSVTDRDGDFTVEVPAAALSKLVKSKAELRALKSDQKKAAKAQSDALATEAQAHEATKAELAKALRKVQSLAKKIEAAASQAAPEASSKPAAKKAAKAAKPAQADSAPVTELVHSDPAAPSKVSPKNPVAAAVDAAAAPIDPPALPGA